MGSMKYQRVREKDKRRLDTKQKMTAHQENGANMGLAWSSMEAIAGRVER